MNQNCLKTRIYFSLVNNSSTVINSQQSILKFLARQTPEFYGKSVEEETEVKFERLIFSNNFSNFKIKID